MNLLAATPQVRKLFLYGIFLNEHTRVNYRLPKEVKYATVKDYMTFGDYIVEAHRIPDVGACLTGIVVEVPDNYDWTAIDRLESGYYRNIITTTDGELAYMYVGRSYDDEK